MPNDRQPVSQPDVVDLVLRLRSLVAEFPEEARAACQRLSKRTSVHIQTKIEEHRQRVLTELSLLPLAREIALERLAGRNDHDAPSDLVLDPENPPQGFESIGFPLGPLSRRIAGAFRAVGRWDANVRNKLDSEIGFLGAAHTGEFGEWTAAFCIDLRATSAVDAYVHALSVPLSHPKHPPQDRETADDIRRRLDPEGRPTLGADGWWAMVEFVTDRIRSSRRSRNTTPARADCWEVAVLALTGADPDFRAPDWGWADAPEWHENPEESGLAAFSDRASVLDTALHFTTGDPSENAPFWSLVGTAVQILESRPARRPTPDQGSPPAAPDTGNVRASREVEAKLREPAHGNDASDLALTTNDCRVFGGGTTSGDGRKGLAPSDESGVPIAPMVQPMAAPPSKAIHVDVKSLRVAMEDSEVLPIATKRQAEVLATIVAAGGNWVSGTDLREKDNPNEKIDRIVRGLPERVQARIEGKTGAGYRLLPPLS